jgi:hypothetical protein
MLHLVPYANPKLAQLYFRTIGKDPARREQQRRSSQQWRQKNIEYARARDAWRQSIKRGHQTPWADPDELLDFYALAATATRLMGQPYEVDHIVPLNHPLVCGLHVPANLKVVTRAQNRSKHNRHWPDMPDAEGKPPKERKSRAKSAT